MSQAPDQNENEPAIQQFRHPSVGARVPERVARGVYSSGAIVMRVGGEFILDFVQRITRPYMVNARVVVPASQLPSFIAALRRNLELYEQKWGAPKEPPRPPQPVRPPSFQEIYDDLKVTEEVQSGAFANALIISHSPSDFCLDFVTTFFPNSAVSARVFLSAGQLPGLVHSLTTTYDHYRRQSAPASDSPGTASSPESPDLPPSPDDPQQGRHEPDSLSGESRDESPKDS